MPRDTINLDAVLKKHGLTRQDLQARLGVSNQAVSAWACNRNRMSPALAIRASELLSIDRAEFRPDLWQPTQTKKKK